MKKLTVLILMAGMLTLFYGCGGGSNTPDDGDPDKDGSDAGGDPGGSINGELTGRVFYSESVFSYEIDLVTGERSRLFTGSDGDFVEPSMDGKALVYVDESPDIFVFIDRVTIRDGNGRMVGAFDLSDGEVSGPVKMSPDRQTIALRWRNKSNSESNSTLTLFSRDGSDNVWQWRRPFPEAASFDWMPDGRLLYSQGKSIYISDTSLSHSTLVVQSLPSNPWQMDVSHDGQQVAFTLPRPVDSVDIMRDVWTMKLDGSDLRQLTATSAIFWSTSIPTWSPDGKWIMLRSGRYNCPNVYAIPTDALRLNVRQDPQAREIKYFEEDLDFEDPPRASRTCGSPVLSWLPPAEKADPGALPQDTGLPNRGLTGTLYYFQKEDGGRNESWALDLSSGQRSRLADTIRGTAASADGQEFAYITSKDDDNAETVVIVDRNGNETARFNRPYALSGPVRFSPNGNLLAFIADETVKAGEETTDQEDIIVTTRDGANQAIFPSFRNSGYDWLSDDDLVLGQTDGIYRGNIQSGTVTRLFPLTDPVLDLAVSPDGQRLAFRMIGRLWVSDLDGQNLHRLTKSEGFERLPEWSPDGRYIAFEHVNNAIVRSSLKGALWVVAADARNVHVSIPEKHRNGMAVQQMKEDGSLELVIDPFSYTSWR